MAKKLGNSIFRMAAREGTGMKAVLEQSEACELKLPSCRGNIPISEGYVGTVCGVPKFLCGSCARRVLKRLEKRVAPKSSQIVTGVGE